uniref:Uncharacterized protein n=1 Tax=Myoviridae sp. ctjhW4 TaxID=2825162 RepID=A0A8S5PRA2_9CAUD|nr:MAG TPA: hypothetical protein [Myoviridae sp. ctjhW4]
MKNQYILTTLILILVLQKILNIQLDMILMMM